MNVTDKARNPWIILVNELLDGVSGFLGIVAGNYFSAEAAPDGMLASMNGVLTAAVYGAGSKSFAIDFYALFPFGKI